MHYRPLLLSTTLAAAFLPAVLLGAQAPAKTPAQVIGLRHWTRAQVNDSLVKHFGPGGGLDSHACGANLIKLGFARSSVIGYVDQDKRSHIVVALVEPEDSVRVRTNVIPRMSALLPNDWEPVLAAFRDTSGKWILSNELTGMVALYPMFTRGQADSARAIMPRFRATPSQEVLWTFLSAHRSAADKETALKILANDSSYEHRVLATTILTNFSADDQTWYQLVHLLRDPNDNVAMLASSILSGFARAPQRTIDWAPVAEDIRYVLAGANLWILPDFIRLLNQTQIAPALAKQVLADNDTYVAGYAGVQGIPRASIPAQQLLARANGGATGGSTSGNATSGAHAGGGASVYGASPAK